MGVVTTVAVDAVVVITVGDVIVAFVVVVAANEIFMA